MSDSFNLEIGLKGEASLVVTEATTAPAVGTGRIAVFATPTMIALMEAAAVDCMEARLPSGQASLGSHLDVRHIKPSPIGARIKATAEIVAIDGRAITFRLEAHDEHEVIGTGTHTRVVVEVSRFEAKVAAKRGTAR
jgi:predicted thioesterase